MKYSTLQHSTWPLETSLTGKALDFGSREYGFESRVSNFLQTNQYSYLLSQLKLGSQSRRYHFEVRVSTALKPLLLILQRINVIRRFHRVSVGSDLYRVFPTYSRYRRNTRTLRTYCKKRGRVALSLKSLRLLNFNSPHSYYIVETSKGVMTHKDALRFQQGGLLLAIIH